MKKGVFLLFLLLLTGVGSSCRKKAALPPPTPPAPVAVGSAPAGPAIEVEPVVLEPPPVPDPVEEPAAVVPAPALEAELLFAHGDLLAAEVAYRALLETSIDGPTRARILLHLAMIYADPSIVLYDPQKSLGFLSQMEEADPMDRSEAATLSHLLSRVLELEADRQSVRRALQRVEQELEKLKSIDERRVRRP